MQANHLVQKEFGVQPILYTGLGSVIGTTLWTSGEASAFNSSSDLKSTNSINYPHPVVESLVKHGKAAEYAEQMRILRASQGMHAPLRIAMEQRIMRRIQPRLPGLYSHHPLAAQLDGTLDEIDIPDFISPSEDAESMGSPQLIMEHKLGLL